MANYQTKLVLRPEFVLRSGSHPQSSHAMSVLRFRGKWTILTETRL